MGAPKRRSVLLWIGWTPPRWTRGRQNLAPAPRPETGGRVFWAGIVWCPADLARGRGFRLVDHLIGAQ
jgi:hypothetical protein